MKYSRSSTCPMAGSSCSACANRPSHGAFISAGAYAAFQWFKKTFHSPSWAFVHSSTSLRCCTTAARAGTTAADCGVCSGQSRNRQRDFLRRLNQRKPEKFAYKVDYVSLYLTAKAVETRVSTFKDGAWSRRERDRASCRCG